MDDYESIPDTEFKRYLQIMRPYLAQLLDQDVIEICKAWIQRLSNCNDNEKILRNKYIFALCYQLAKGVLEEPFLKFPESGPLEPISEDLDSDVSEGNEIDYLIIDCEEDTKVMYNNSPVPTSDTNYLSPETELCKADNGDDYCKKNNDYGVEKKCLKLDKQSILCNDCPEVVKEYENNYKSQCDEYKYRANNLVMKLREIKTQNMMLQKELNLLRNECKMKNEGKSYGNDCCVCECWHADDSKVALSSLKNHLQDEQDAKKAMIETINNLQEKIKAMEDIKRREIEEIEANYKTEINKIKSTTPDETKEMFENKLDEIKQHYEKLIENLQKKLVDDRQVIASSKDEVITEKEKMLKSKDIEIYRLKTLIEDQKNHLHDVINKFLEKPSEELNTENMRIKTEELEKRLNKVEKSKTKCARMYEAKLAHLQKEKYLTECSLQLQLVRQRTQVVNELSDDSQAELNTALNKLENKYKEIVANMQATAIQRRMQDQMALESILHAACGIRTENYANNSQSQFSGKTIQNINTHGNQGNQSFDSEISTLLHGNKVDGLIRGNKSLGEGSVMAGYCLDGERMGELFERVYIPQRDIGDGSLKK